MKRGNASKLAAQPERQGAPLRPREARTQAERVRASLVLCPGKRA